MSLTLLQAGQSARSPWPASSRNVVHRTLHRRDLWKKMQGESTTCQPYRGCVFTLQWKRVCLEESVGQFDRNLIVDLMRFQKTRGPYQARSLWNQSRPLRESVDC